jgi:hypothetical protein
MHLTKHMEVFALFRVRTLVISGFFVWLLWSLASNCQSSTKPTWPAGAISVSSYEYGLESTTRDMSRFSILDPTRGQPLVDERDHDHN